MRMTRFPFAALFLAAPFVFTGCATPGAEEGTPASQAQPQQGVTVSAPSQAKAPPADQNAKLYKGTGVVVKGQLPGGAMPAGPAAPAAGGGVVLNFEGADLREVVRNILGDILGESYTIDQSVGGQVTIRTASGIPREALPATLEMLLRMNGAAMVKEGGVYKIVPQAAAVRGNITPQLGTSNRALPAGYSVQIVPLRYVGAKEMVRLLEPFAKDAQAIRADELRNLVILSGTERELKHLLEAIDMFDIDWMAGMSVGVFTLQNSDVKTLMTELDKVIGDRNTSPLAGILRIIPIERMNALLVISPQPSYLEEAKKWITRLDSGAGGDGPRLFVYHLQSQRAEKLAPLLQQAFTGRAAPATQSSQPTVAPGTPAGSIVSPPTFQQQPTGLVQPTVNLNAQVTPAPGTTTSGAGGQGLGIVRNLQVVADKDNNTLLVVATPGEYSVIEAALKRLDVPSRQVMMAVTIAEVTLNDQLDFGVEWLFRGGAPSGQGSGGNLTRSTPINPVVPTASGTTNNGLSLAQGFVYIINNAAFPGGIQAVLRLLDTYADTKVLANPRLAAIDNQKATIKVGNKIPINQQSNIGGGTGTSTVVTTTAQYIDTGVLVQVTPHINAGGLVTLDVQAEVSIPASDVADGQAPPINSRSIQTMVSVQSGQTMIMGGLINEVKQNASAGLPLLSRIPVLGGFFGSQTLTTNRTELVMFITPNVIENELDLKGMIGDLRKKMSIMDDYLQSTGLYPGLNKAAEAEQVSPAKPAAPLAAPVAPVTGDSTAPPASPPPAPVVQVAPATTSAPVSAPAGSPAPAATFGPTPAPAAIPAPPAITTPVSAPAARKSSSAAPAAVGQSKSRRALAG